MLVLQGRGKELVASDGVDAARLGGNWMKFVSVKAAQWGGWSAGRAGQWVLFCCAPVPWRAKPWRTFDGSRLDGRTKVWGRVTTASSSGDAEQEGKLLGDGGEGVNRASAAVPNPSILRRPLRDPKSVLTLRKEAFVSSKKVQ